MTLNVLVTGAGGVYGEATVGNLRKCALPVRIVGADVTWHASGSLRSDRPVVLPLVTDPTFVDRLVEVVRAEAVRAVFVCSGTEIKHLAARRDELEERTGATFIMPAAALYTLASDKLATARWLEEHGFAHPRTYDAASYTSQLELPIMAKPRFGMGSRGLAICRSGADLARVRATGDDYVFQEYLGDIDHEFTVGVIATEEREVLGSIVLRRWLAGGQTGACEVVPSPLISEYAEAIARELAPRGYVNIQLRLRDGKPVCFEINARVSSSTGFRTLAGFNEPELVLRKYVLGETPPRPTPRAIAMVRGLEERIVDPETWNVARPS